MSGSCGGRSGGGVGVEYHIRAMALKNGAPRHRNLKSFAFLARAAECSHALLPTQTRAQTRSETKKKHAYHDHERGKYWQAAGKFIHYNYAPIRKRSIGCTKIMKDIHGNL